MTVQLDLARRPPRPLRLTRTAHQVLALTEAAANVAVLTPRSRWSRAEGAGALPASLLIVSLEAFWQELERRAHDADGGAVRVNRWELALSLVGLAFASIFVFSNVRGSTSLLCAWMRSGC
ncbi:MAG: hypothetical protein M3P18_21755 [Actinomycetota bacterium]|nr:hypothetical protein [Actinomycetota bacterium]